MDDLTDEGYTTLNDRMEADFSCLTRLRKLLAGRGARPFGIAREGRPYAEYSSDEFELSGFLYALTAEAKAAGMPSNAPFLKSVYDYCRWIGYEEDTAYVFLLRDTLLPYVYFKARDRQSVYPWLISRKFLEDITGIEYVDDDIRLPIYEALENGHTDFEDCCSFCRERMLAVLDMHPILKQTLTGLLNSLKEKRVVIVESGYMGTMPMMLKALDDRVTFRLYTTAPFLYETYADNIFCRRYEDIRLFETVYAQDLLTRYSSFHGGKFYVNVANNEDIRRRALAEINEFMR